MSAEGAPLLRSGILAWLPAVLLALAVLLAGLWIYYPGIDGPSLLDDRSSVLVIGDLRETPDQAMDYVFGDSSGLLGRSVSMGTFVLERLYLGDDLRISKTVNIVLHLVNGGLLIWLFWLLFRFLQVPGYAPLAVLLGAIWLLHPLLVSSVLYVVQRMAILTTLFMLAAILSYVYWRLALLRGRWRSLPLVLVPVFIALGMFAKENAIVVVPVLLLLEVLWFECKGSDGRPLAWLRRFSLGAIAAGAFSLLAILVFGYSWLAARFHRRPFSLDERLMTQARVVWDYVGQWVWPDTTKMGIYHDDVVVSTALGQPGSTLYAVAAWGLLVLVCTALLRWQWGRYLVLGVAWFLVGHAVESTVLPLEMYFEHRNYFPAIGLVLVLGVAFAALLTGMPETRVPGLLWLAFLPLLVAAQTSSQVQVWSSRPLLILNHLNGHPGSMRANIDMAVEMSRLGDPGAALKYSRLAHQANPHELPGDRVIRDIALTCVAGGQVPGEWIDALGTSNPGYPLGSVTTLLTMVRIIENDECPGMDSMVFADRLAAIYLDETGRAGASANMYSNLASLENALQRWENALAYAELFLAKAPGNKRGLLMKLHFATALGKVAERDEVIATLMSLQEQGGLTVGEQRTLALYLEK